jgi:hypothetical protein
MAYRNIPRKCPKCGKMIKGALGVAPHMAKHQREEEREVKPK